jgi:quinol monooxygenase YgiN
MTTSLGTEPTLAAAYYVMVMRVGPEQYDRAIAAATNDLQSLQARVPGVLRCELFGTDDRSEILIISEWVDAAAWSRAQWDPEVQRMVADRFGAAERVHAKLYRPVAVPAPSTVDEPEVYGDENAPGHLE